MEQNLFGCNCIRVFVHSFVRLITNIYRSKNIQKCVFHSLSISISLSLSHSLTFPISTFFFICLVKYYKIVDTLKMRCKWPWIENRPILFTFVVSFVSLNYRIHWYVHRISNDLVSESVCASTEKMPQQWRPHS